MGLAEYIKQKRKEKEILLMAHQVLGYPDLDTNERIIREFDNHGVDLLELQIPFSEPMADGPLFLHANQEALARGIRVEDCFAFAQGLASHISIPLLFMTYYNIVYRHGIRAFVERTAATGVQGLIIPDALPEESQELISVCRETAVDLILLATPFSDSERIRHLGKQGSGFMYCVARKGVTGDNTDMGGELETFLKRARQATDLPLGVGFGIKSRADIDFLRGKADIAIIGSQFLRTYEESGLEGLQELLVSLE